MMIHGARGAARALHADHAMAAVTDLELVHSVGERQKSLERVAPAHHRHAPKREAMRAIFEASLEPPHAREEAVFLGAYRIWQKEEALRELFARRLSPGVVVVEPRL